MLLLLLLLRKFQGFWKLWSGTVDEDQIYISKYNDHFFRCLMWDDIFATCSMEKIL